MRDLTPEEQAAERDVQSARENADAALNVIRAVATGHLQALGPDGALFLARCIVDQLAALKLPGAAPPNVLLVVATARAGSEAMLDVLQRRTRLRPVEAT